MTMTAALTYEKIIPDVLGAMAGIHEVIAPHGLDRRLRHLVHLRASQINHCGYCVTLHTREARQDGETNERLDRLTVWDQVRDFSDSEAVVGHDQTKLGVLTRHLTALFGAHLPTQTLVPVPRLALDGMVFEIDAIVALGPSGGAE